MSGPQLDIDAIEARAEAATAGPWEVNAYDSGHSKYEMAVSIHTAALGDHVCGMDGLARHDNERDARDDGYNDAQFIAAARTDVPDLCAEVRQLRQALTEALRELDNLGPLGPGADGPNFADEWGTQ